MKYPLPLAALAHHTAFLGKTGSGKTTSAKGAVEAILRADSEARVCILDPIKSDWWGMTSSASGKAPGFPFQILGGPHGHVPLNPAAGKVVGELVGRGALPLSIIDMADFKAGDLQTFFNEFAPALMRSMRGVLHLVLEEAHEFAPKERAGIGAETHAIYWAKKLATAGRSKGIRLIVVTQATQQLHNRVLGSCETMVAHRFFAPADQRPVLDWLKTNMPKGALAEVEANLAKLKTGTAYVASAERQGVDLVTFPPLTTFDNSATPTGNDAAREVKTAAVDRDRLAAIMGEAVAEAEANDPAKLRARVRELEAEAARKPAPAVDPAALESARLGGLREGFTQGVNATWQFFGQHLEAEARGLDDALHRLTALTTRERPQFQGPSVLAPVAPTWSSAGGAPTTASRQASARVHEGIEPRQQRMLDAIAWWNAARVEAPTRVQVAALTGHTASGGGFRNILGSLVGKDLVEAAGTGAVRLTEAGRQAANSPGAAPTTAELHRRIEAVIEPRQWRMLERVIREWPGTITRQALAEYTGHEPTGGGFRNILGSVSGLGFITSPRAGEVRAADILFVE